MENLSPFCTCPKTACPLHPTKHSKGCAPCIQKNLRTREMPNCYFNLVEGMEKRTGTALEDFAKLVLKAHTKQE